MMLIYPSNTEIKINNIGSIGYIESIVIRESTVTYHVRYFYDGEQRYAHLIESEFTTVAK